VPQPPAGRYRGPLFFRCFRLRHGLREEEGSGNGNLRATFLGGFEYFLIRCGKTGVKVASMPRVNCQGVVRTDISAAPPSNRHKGYFHA
jgi:hypothetical protein